MVFFSQEDSPSSIASIPAQVCPHEGPGLTLLGVPVDGLRRDEVLVRLCAWITQGGFHQVATANVNFLVNSLRSEELHRVLGGCDLVIPDGVPLLWLSRWLGRPLPERIAGIDLIPELARLSATHGYRIFFLGGVETNVLRAIQNLTVGFPGVNIVGHCSPPQSSLDDMDNDAILAQIEAARPDILLVGFGNPKQELWLARMRHRLQVPVCIGVGGSVNFLSGAVQRAPLKYQKLGLEWFYRIVQEPRRLAWRYLQDLLDLVGPLSREFLTLAMQPTRRGLHSVQLSTGPGVIVLTLSGGLTAQDCSALSTHAESAAASGSRLILDLSALHYLGPDALPWLIRLSFALRAAGAELCLASPRPSVRRFLRSCRIDGLLRVETTGASAPERFVREQVLPHYDDNHVLRPVPVEPELHPQSTL